ncbi:MAG: YkgJ family cysteine cluster protein [Bdellovibrionales bacterium]|nr:YkgJ family cysteine cluster protein [Bdellovibrionales bacterium]
MSAESNPCISCGACCARFRVSFDSLEKVPPAYHYPLSPYKNALKSKIDSEGRPRCTALRGALGNHVSCGIYDFRPSPCRAFRYSYEGGGPREERCDQARASIGLAPLTRPSHITEGKMEPKIQGIDLMLNEFS